ncbi:MAG: creatininase family protein, partial [Proteobacteria bacterium]|nr:creatininase family protein [Pseudomonadota bacterium]
MPNPHAMAEITWPEFHAYVDAGAVAFIPTGALEQHGPHLPLGVDHML